MSVTRLQFPPQTGPYAIKVKEGDKRHNFDTIRLEISVGQSYHEGDKFLCTVDWAKSRFQNVVILCNDTLQRYNAAIQAGDAPDDHLSETHKAGTDWINRNHVALKGTTLCRWEDWRNLPHFKEATQAAYDLYSSDAQFHHAVLESITSVFNRRLAKGLISVELQDAFTSRSLEYLMEETAGLAIAYETHPGISAYPGTFLEMWRMFVGQPIESRLKGLSNAHCIRIDFDRKQPLPVRQLTKPDFGMLAIPDINTV